MNNLYRRITKRPEDNIYYFYQVIKKDIEGTGDLGEGNIDNSVEKKKDNWIKRLLVGRISSPL